MAAVLAFGTLPGSPGTLLGAAFCDKTLLNYLCLIVGVGTNIQLERRS
jgi:hypothetical protein